MLPSHLKKRKKGLGRHGKQGSSKKIGAKDTQCVERREAIAAAATLHSAALRAAEAGAAPEEQAAAAAAARMAARDAVRAKAAVKKRASTSSDSAHPKRPRPLRMVAPATTASEAPQPSPPCSMESPPISTTGQSSRTPAGTGAKQQRAKWNRKYYLKQRGQASATKSDAATRSVAPADPWAVNKHGNERSAVAARNAKSRVVKPAVHSILGAGSVEAATNSVSCGSPVAKL